LGQDVTAADHAGRENDHVDHRELPVRRPAEPHVERLPGMDLLRRGVEVALDPKLERRRQYAEAEHERQKKDEKGDRTSQPSLG
jgi:hypothetical protein